MLVSPRLTEKGNRELYDGAYYEGKGFDPAVRHIQEYDCEDEEQKAPTNQPNNLIRILKELAPPPAKLLDFGCGIGDFVRHARNAGYDAKGFEVSEFGSQFARSKGLTIFTSEAELPHQEFDIVTSIEVLEHCFAPMAALQAIYSCLKPGGLFFYNTGNFDGYYENWKRGRKDKEANEYIVPEGHINFFSSKAMRKALTAVGFSQVFDFEPKSYIKAGRIYRALRNLRLVDHAADSPQSFSEKVAYYGARRLCYFAGLRRPWLPLARK
jgi:SAM-dependent methyltransferase